MFLPRSWASSRGRESNARAWRMKPPKPSSRRRGRARRRVDRNLHSAKFVGLDDGARCTDLIGIFTALLGRWVGPHGHVYAFEPAPETRSRLLDHMTLNH